MSQVRPLILAESSDTAVGVPVLYGKPADRMMGGRGTGATASSPQ